MYSRVDAAVALSCHQIATAEKALVLSALC